MVLVQLTFGYVKPFKPFSQVLKLQEITTMLECRRDERSANFPSAGFLRSFGSDPPASPPDPEGRPVDRTLLLVYLRLRGTEKNPPACITSDLFAHSFCVVSGTHLAL